MKKLDIKQIGAKVDATTKETIEKSMEVGKMAAVAVQKSTADLSEKVKNTNYQNRLKKYNPLFPDTFFGDSFKVPNIIKIVDDAERKEIDVCAGAIGWLGKTNNVEILYLYDEIVGESGLVFVPMAQCDSVYYMDSLDRKRFIRSDMICSVAHEEQVAELKHIARMLGAKKCIIEIKERKKVSSKIEKKISLEEKKRNVGSADEGYEMKCESDSNSFQDGKIVAEFEGSNEAKRPTLKWFTHNNSLNDLIEGKLDGTNKSKREMIVFSGLTSSTISQQAASAIDSAVGGIMIKGKMSVAKQMKQEMSKNMYFKVEF